ncbi:RrF2 family transcriptional regulator [Paenibacillus thermotolerans]|uniref:RrF2 family transcriptional regulator n=1 Tax=Paenibacillus thermotolerans TaxID=3027807 RepID=UPI002367B355|nr:MULTISPECIES: Rrf2 family transcriptional regulator [unclassified Paenibacillus]
MNSEFTIAVHSLVLLAYKCGNMATSEQIAANVATHPARVRKVMGCLRKGGFVSTKEGLGGGYLLSCDPERVTLADIYRAMCPGSLKPGWSSGDPEQYCMVSSNIQCVMDTVFAEAERHLESFFERLTVADVLTQIREADLSKGAD